MTKDKRFIVSIDNKNGVGLYDGDIRLLYFQFNNIQDATECKDALKHQCSLMNELHEENEELKQSIDNMCGKLQGLWAHYNTTRHGIWADAVEDVAKELGFKIDKR